MIKDICEAIAQNSVFSSYDIFEAYSVCESFDLVISAIDICQSTGTMNLLETVKQHMEKS